MPDVLILQNRLMKSDIKCSACVSVCVRLRVFLLEIWLAFVLRKFQTENLLMLMSEQ